MTTLEGTASRSTKKGKEMNAIKEIVLRVIFMVTVALRPCHEFIGYSEQKKIALHIVSWFFFDTVK